MIFQRDLNLLFLVLYVTGSLLGAMAKSISWADSQLTVDPSQYLHASINDEFRRDSMEAPDRDNHIYTPLSKSKLQLIPEVQWQQSAENMKRWLNNHFKSINSNSKSDYVDSDLYGQSAQFQQGKRSSSGYMCHFKLCQLGASGSGKRRWNPSAFD